MTKKHAIPAFAFGIPFGVLLGMAYSLESSISTSILVGIAGGVAAAVAVAGYAAFSDRRWSAWAERIAARLTGEEILFRGRAVACRDDHVMTVIALFSLGWLGLGANVDGLLILTRKRLLFVPSEKLRRVAPTEIPTNDILGVAPGTGLAKRAIRIGTRSNVVLHFKVDDRDAWIAALPGTKLGARA